MKLCILSDSHDNETSLAAATALIRDLAPDLVIHCGDLCSPAMLEYFIGLNFSSVFGNCDSEISKLKAKAAELKFNPPQELLTLSLGGKSLLVYHGTNSRVLEAHQASQEFDYIFHGHSHLIRDEHIGKTRVINPGALHRAKHYTFAELDLESDSLRLIEINPSRSRLS